MLSGPENMPVFSDNQLTPTRRSAIITYVQTCKASKDPGGNGIDRIGPVSEALVIWVAGIGALVIAILWIGAKSHEHDPAGSARGPTHADHQHGSTTRSAER